VTLEDAFSLPEEMPEELWEHEVAMAIRGKIINVLTEKMDGLSAQLNEDNMNADAAVALAVLMIKMAKVLVGMIDELGSRKMQGEAVEEQKEQVIQLAGKALSKALGPVDGPRLAPRLARLSPRRSPRASPRPPPRLMPC